jgi:hypothetical protein
VSISISETYGLERQTKNYKINSLHRVQCLQPRSWQIDLQDGHEDLGLWKCPLKKKLSKGSTLYTGRICRKNIGGQRSPSA